MLRPRNYGTGSWPVPPHGWQRAKRLAANQLPRTAPYLAIASAAYAEQVGVYRHTAGSSGETPRW
jgi:hypothetical protein